MAQEPSSKDWNRDTVARKSGNDNITRNAQYKNDSSDDTSLDIDDIKNLSDTEIIRGALTRYTTFQGGELPALGKIAPTIPTGDRKVSQPNIRSRSNSHEQQFNPIKSAPFEPRPAVIVSERNSQAEPTRDKIQQEERSKPTSTDAGHTKQGECPPKLYLTISPARALPDPPSGAQNRSDSFVDRPYPSPPNNPHQAVSEAREEAGNEERRPGISRRPTVVDDDVGEMYHTHL